jgi:cytochrome c peroxidase
MGKFRVPTLRNVAVTAPYMHDGSIATLEGVLDHYAGGGRAKRNRNSDAPTVRDSIIKPIVFTQEEREELIAFLNSLTDAEFSNPQQQECAR